MAKKRKKKQGGKRRTPGPSKPAGAAPPSAEAAASAGAGGSRDERRAAAKERREAQARKRKALERRKRIRNLAVLTVVVLLVAGFVVYRSSANKAKTKKFDAVMASAGCTKVETTSAPENRGHLQPGETVRYPTSPPTVGKHSPSPLTAGVYQEPLSDDVNAQSPTVYQAVHSLEHGYVVVWHKGLTDAQLSAIEKAFGTERKVIVAPYPSLDKGTVALTSWERLTTCQKPETKAIQAFIDRFREKTGPEPAAA